MPYSIRATVMQTPSREDLQVLHDVVISIDDDGAIIAIDDHNDFEGKIDHALSPTAVLMPGLVDLHVHAPQWPQLGTGLDIDLERWLFEYTFPLEASFTDLDFAQEVWTGLVSTLLGHGTTTAVYFATQDLDATTLLAKTCVELGQRSYVGRVAMDHPEGTPEWYRDESASAGIRDSAASIRQIQNLESPLVKPIITPRFVPACSDELLEGLGELAQQTGVSVQTHCSESDWEHNYVLERHGMTDTQSLQRFGLLGPGTVLAHGDFIDDDDFKTIAEVDAGVAHCPLSNAYFGNAVFPIRRALDAGVKVGLGTDIAGGSEPGLLPQCAHAVTASRYLEDGVDPRLDATARATPDSRINTTTAFWLATLGGSDVLDANVGLLEVGRLFDAFVVDAGASPGSPLRRWAVDSDERWFEKIIRLARPADITNVWVNGVQLD